MTTSLFDPLSLKNGVTLKNRFVMAPLTNCQSHADGRLSDDEYRWLVMRAEGGFGLTMTCATSVQKEGVAFPGQLGCYDDAHLEGLTRLASAIKARGSHAIVQIHHGGARADKALTGRATMGPSDDSEYGAVAMTLAEVHRARDAYIAAAQRCARAGFDGVEVHGAHGYLIAEFLSAQSNRRSDEYGGSLENRSRFLFEVIDGVHKACGAAFTLGLRLSPERFGLRLDEMRDVAAEVMRDGRIDFLDMSLWDVFKAPMDEAFQGRSLASYFTDLDRNGVRLGAAGKIRTAAEARRLLDLGFDFAVVGRAAVLHHDFPRRVAADADFASIATPVSVDYLRREGLADAFVRYMRNWKDFVEEVETTAA